MTTMAFQITSLSVVYSTVYSEAGQRKRQRSASLAFVWGLHRDRWIPRTKGQLRGNISLWWRHYGSATRYHLYHRITNTMFMPKYQGLFRSYLFYSKCETFMFWNNFGWWKFHGNKSAPQVKSLFEICDRMLSDSIVIVDDRCIFVLSVRWQPLQKCYDNLISLWVTQFDTFLLTSYFLMFAIIVFEQLQKGYIHIPSV